MDRTQIIAELEKNIADLSAARALLTNVEASQKPARKMHLVKRTVSPAARERMKAAQQKRWRKVKRSKKVQQEQVLGRA